MDGFEVANGGLDPLNADTDGNGTGDGAEDPDGDTLTNLEEQALGTDPNSEDTDGDSLPDDWEGQYAELDPTDAWSGRDQATEPRDDLWDIDGDGYTNLQEYSDGHDPTDPKDPPPSGSTKSSGECAARGAGSAAGFALWALALVALARRPVTA